MLEGLVGIVSLVIFFNIFCNVALAIDWSLSNQSQLSEKRLNTPFLEL